MATLVSELVRVLSDAAARELKARAEGPPLSRAEMVALATLNELAADYLSAPPEPALPADAADWSAMAALAAFDARLIAENKVRRSSAS